MLLASREIGRRHLNRSIKTRQRRDDSSITISVPNTVFVLPERCRLPSTIKVRTIGSDVIEPAESTQLQEREFSLIVSSQQDDTEGDEY
jgi:hypothetical protein